MVHSKLLQCPWLVSFSTSETVSTSRSFLIFYMKTKMNCLLPVIWRRFNFFYSDALNVYVLSWICWERERLIAATASNAYNIVSPIWGQYGSNLGNFWPLGGITKERKVASGYRGIEPGILGLHAWMLATLLPLFKTSL